MPIPNLNLDQYIPGFSGNAAAAGQNIGAQLTGLPSTGPARTKAAYFGATSGMPNSGVSNALGYDLYRQAADQYQQQGLDNFLKMLTGFSGTVAPTTGEAIQSSQFDTTFNDNRRKEDLARQDAEYAMANTRRRRPASGIYRLPGQLGPVPGGSNLPWWNQN